MFKLPSNVLKYLLSDKTREFLRNNNVYFTKNLLWHAYQEPVDSQYLLNPMVVDYPQQDVKDIKNEPEFYIECFGEFYSFYKRYKVDSLEEGILIAQDLNKVLDVIITNSINIFNCEINYENKNRIINRLSQRDNLGRQEGKELVNALLSKANVTSNSMKQELEFHSYIGIEELEGKGHISNQPLCPYPFEVNEQLQLKIGHPTTVYRIEEWVISRSNDNYYIPLGYPLIEGVAYDGTNLILISNEDINYEGERLLTTKDKYEAETISKLLNEAFKKGRDAYRAKLLTILNKTV